ncbi:MerR family transcriptional regulator [Paenibacillus sp. IB182493]|uniref:MerR family transcriptional regulator n=1 Tax=Paenibacillus arenilitoris TaxID=2772299 RepID=A0A927CM29_9BACL|nr:MerR family transcriptional regulator [Paenibacillus arenilitoris]
MEPTYTITDISKRTGLSHDTIRYYEKINLIPGPARSDSGQRVYAQLDMDRYIFVSILKKTNMPLKKIQSYMDHSSRQEYEVCYAVLKEHASRIESQMADMLATLDILRYKLKHFEELKTGDFLQQHEEDVK